MEVAECTMVYPSTGDSKSDAVVGIRGFLKKFHQEERLSILAAVIELAKSDSDEEPKGQHGTT